MLIRKNKLKRYLIIILSIVTVLSFTIPVNAYSPSDSINIDNNKIYSVSCNSKILNEELLFKNPMGEYIYILDGKTLKKHIREGKVVEYEEEQKARLLADSTKKWDLDMINFKPAETGEYLGEGIIVGVLDSGVDANHEDLSENILEGYDIFKKNSDVTDNIGHGTKVSGMIAAMLNNSGINGVAPKAKIVPIKCFDNGKSTYSSHLAEAIYTAIDSYDCDVLNLSACIDENSNLLKDAVKYATSKGVIICAAAGNYYNTQGKKDYYPASYEDVISVSSVDSNGEIAASSQRNENITVAAPGEKIYTTAVNNSYVETSGTSFATPIVTGIIADMLSIKKDLSIPAIKKILTATATDKGDVGYDICYGYGLVNLGKCVETVAENDCIAFIEKKEDDTVDVSIINLRDTAINDKFFLGNYNYNNKLINVKMNDISIEPYEMITLNFENMTDDVFKCYFLNESFYPEIGFNLYK